MANKSKRRTGKPKSESNTQTEDSSVADEPPITVISNKRAPPRSWKLPTVRHELILYVELFAVCCLVFIIHLFAMIPWDHITRLIGLTFRHLHSGNFTTNATNSDSIIQTAKFFMELQDKLDNSTQNSTLYLIHCK